MWSCSWVPSLPNQKDEFVYFMAFLLLIYHRNYGKYSSILGYYACGALYNGVGFI